MLGSPFVLIANAITANYMQKKERKDLESLNDTQVNGITKAKTENLCLETS